jgi:hypothetical protein
MMAYIHSASKFIRKYKLFFPCSGGELKHRHSMFSWWLPLMMLIF